MNPPRAQPLYFGSAERPLFGWLHRSTHDNDHSMGIVLCNPFGYEAICTHRTIKALAEQAAQRGFPTLRFDYDGTGDSAGCNMDPDRLAAWLASIRIAIDTLKATSGVEQVCLFGIRLGATLAASVATERDDVDALIAFAPVVNARTYLRELRALELSRPQSAPPPGTSVDPDWQEAAGFATSEQTRASLSTLDLMRLESTPARHAIIFTRDDLPPTMAWQQHLLSQGAIAQQLPLQGYVAMMKDAHETTVPLDTIHLALSWLEKINASETTEAQVRADQQCKHLSNTSSITLQQSESGASLRETSVFLDAEKTQFGIISEPLVRNQQSPNQQSRKQVLLLLNSGSVHHIGPNRLYVTLARRCAAHGVPVLRLDISGLGDSQPHSGEPENSVYTARANDDIKQALAFAASYFGTADYHIAGVCSGGFHALKAAVHGIKLSSIVVINPLTFFWQDGMTLAYPEFHVTAETRRYRRTALQLASWAKLLRGGVDIATTVKVVTRRVSAITINTARNLCRLCNIRLSNDLGTELQILASRDIRMHFIFSSADPGYAMLREQSGSVFSRLTKRRKLRVTVITSADHTFTAKHARDRLVTVIVDHLSAFVDKAAQQ